MIRFAFLPIQALLSFEFVDVSNDIDTQTGNLFFIMLKSPFVLLIFTLAFINANAQDYDLNAGMVAYYPFETGANDTVGVNNGVVHGARIDEGRCGNKSYYFDGSTAYIDCGNDQSLNGRWGGLTISTWIMPMELNSLGLSTIVAKWAFNDQRDHFGMWLNANYHVIMAVSYPGTMEDGTFSKSTLNPKEWYHIVGTWRSNGEIRIYINGELDKIGWQTGRGINFHSDASLKIGRQVIRQSRPYKGYIDELRIYKRALRPEEVKALYNQGKAVCESVTVRGHVYNKKTREPVQGDVVFQDAKTGEIMNKIKTQGDDAYYETVMPIGERYGLYADTDGFLAENQNLSTRGHNPKDVIDRDLYVVPLEAGQSIRLNNIFFDFAKASLRDSSHVELDRVLPYFRKFPKLKIELGGHTDSIGSDEANQKLSEEPGRVCQGIPGCQGRSGRSDSRRRLWRTGTCGHK